jgi:cytochrome c oxidase subunit IV
VSARALLYTWVSLVALAAASFALSFAHLGSLNVPVALLIAAAKAALVALVFMELAVERLSIRLISGTAVAFIAILLFFVLADLHTRPAPPLVPWAR